MTTFFLILAMVIAPILMFFGCNYVGKYYEHKRKLRMQRHHVEWVLSELDRRRKERDA